MSPRIIEILGVFGSAMAIVLLGICAFSRIDELRRSKASKLRRRS